MKKRKKQVWRVQFRNGASRDVLASTKLSALRTAAAAQRLVGLRGDAVRPVTAAVAPAAVSSGSTELQTG